MAQYRLQVQAISRADGRSSVAASAYRSATRLHDARLEMVFDYTDKEGVAFTGVMAPEGAPTPFYDRETLWNAAEAADRQVNSRPCREVLISLPHELTDDQRHELVRAFIGETLVARGMIADYGIHLPDAHGDPRNHHAHILITTRVVGPEGFGLKERDWDNPAAVRALRADWARIQNEHLRRHLGPEAPQVSHLSLADQGEGREPTIHLGPAASGMERRGEASDRGEINRRIHDRNTDRLEAPSKVRELEDRLAQDHLRRAYPIDAVITEFEALHKAMVRERASWALDHSRIIVPSVPTRRAIADEVLSGAAAAKAEAIRRLERVQRRVEQGRTHRSTLQRWIHNPARMIWATHVELNALHRARGEVARAQTGLLVRRAWLRSVAGQAYVAGRLGPFLVQAESARTGMRTLERKIKRADKRIADVAATRTKLLVARELGETTMVAPAMMNQGASQAVREVDRRVVDGLGRYPAAARQAALEKVVALVRGKIPELGQDR